MGQRDVCPLEAGSGVGRAGNNDPVPIENLVDHPGREPLLAFGRQTFDHLNAMATGAGLDDDRSGVIYPDHRLTRRYLVLNISLLIHHHIAPLNGECLPAG